MTLSLSAFPDSFLFGSATSSYQIEGARDADGKGPSIWDRFCDTPGRVAAGDTGDVAVDHYRLWRQDIQLMQALGLNSYRFSISWPRVMPQGRGACNAKGLAFYEALVDGLLKAGIEPNLTLYHWDLPQALEDLGGWQNREVALWFGDYAALMAKTLGDRVRLWSTHNEPFCTAVLGYEMGVLAPGLKLASKGVNQVIHHILLSHGRAVDAVRAQAKGKPELGMVWNLDPAWPLDEAKAEDVEAARRAWSYKNDWWLSPVYRGCYPEEGWAQRGVDVPDVQKGDLEQIARPLDWTGHNFYFPIRYTADPASALKFKQVPKPEGLPANALGWEVNPSGLLTLLNEFTRRYGRMPIFISENGYCGFHESPEADGCVHDPSRVEYLRHHLQACQAALRAGVDLRGYYAWSLLDNFEWSAGYKPQFGLVHVDRGTQARTLKDSAKWYKGFIATHSLGPQEALRDALAPETGRA